MRTHLDIRGDRFFLNGSPTYAEIPKTPDNLHGLLLNARFIQGIYDDAAGLDRYNRFGRGPWDPDRNTEALIAALSEWYRYGLRAFTVGFQGGGPFFTIPNNEIENNPFDPDGGRIDPRYAERMDRLIRAADEKGVVVIVSYLYQGQVDRLSEPGAVLNAVRRASRFIRENDFENVIIEAANEHDVGGPQYISVTDASLSSIRRR